MELVIDHLEVVNEVEILYLEHRTFFMLQSTTKFLSPIVLFRSFFVLYLADTCFL